MRLYHNPRCSKSRQALALLNERDIDFEVYLYLKLGISEDDIDLLSSLDGIIRKNDLEKGSNIDFSDNEEVSKLLKIQPKLLQRPILVLGDLSLIHI